MSPSIDLRTPCRTCGLPPANHRVDDGACRPSPEVYEAAAPLRGRNGEPIAPDQRSLWEAAYWALTTTRYGADSMPSSWAPIRRALFPRAREYEWPREVQQVPTPLPDDRVDALVYAFQGMVITNETAEERARREAWSRASPEDVLRDIEAAARALRRPEPRTAGPRWGYSMGYDAPEQGSVTGRLSMSGRGRGLPTNEAIAAKQPTEPEPFVTSDGPRAAPDLDGPRKEAPGADLHAERFAMLDLD